MKKNFRRLHTAQKSPHTHTLIKLGINPIIAVITIFTDFLLFSGETSTAGLSLIFSLFVALLIGFATIFVQHFSNRDSWGLSLIKGIILAVATAIPTPICSFIPLIGILIGLNSYAPTNNKKSTSSRTTQHPMRNVTPNKKN